MRLGRSALAALGIAAAGIAVWSLARPDPVAVLLREVDRGRVETTVANTRAGTVEACQRARMAPAVGGQIARLPVHEGDHVVAGQLLLELWNDDVRAELKRADGEAVGAHARVDEACTMAEVAEREAQRTLRLRKQGVAAEEATDQAVGQAAAKRAACQALRAAAIVSDARVEATKAALDRTMLHAPFAGVVAEVNGEVGEFVT